MQKLNVRFAPQTLREIEKLVSMLGFDNSKMARAAMDIGIDQILKSYEEQGKKKTAALVGIKALREHLKR